MNDRAPPPHGLGRMRPKRPPHQRRLPAVLPPQPTEAARRRRGGSKLPAQKTGGEAEERVAQRSSPSVSAPVAVQMHPIAHDSKHGLERWHCGGVSAHPIQRKRSTTTLSRVSGREWGRAVAVARACGT